MEKMLKKDHQYYDQVQVPLAVTSANWCDFCILTTKGIAIDHIAPDCRRSYTSKPLSAVILSLFSSIPDCANSSLSDTLAEYSEDTKLTAPERDLPSLVVCCCFTGSDGWMT